MTRTDGGYFVRGNAIIKGDAGREDLICVFTQTVLLDDPYLVHDIANQLNREAGLSTVGIPRRHGPTPYQREVEIVSCDGSPVRALRATGELAFPERYARRDRIRYARILQARGKAVPA